MRKLIVTENVSLDGIMAPMGDWFNPSDPDDELLAVNVEQREAADAVVLGRITYEQFESFWPFQKDDQTGVRDYLNLTPKYVVSSTLQKTGWVNSTILAGDPEVELMALKASAGPDGSNSSEGKDIVITGSAKLVRSLHASGLVDEYRMFVYPVVQGHGRRLFPKGTVLKLRLQEARSFASGVVLLTYHT